MASGPPSRTRSADTPPGVPRNIREMIKAQQAPGYKQATVNRPMGYRIIYDPELGNIEFDTQMCMHCQRHMRVDEMPEGGMNWCGNCGGVVCEQKRCNDTCTHFEKQVEMVEESDALKARMLEMQRA